MSKTHKAKLVLIQMQALQEGDFTGRSIDLAVLAEETLKDAKALAEEVLKEEESLSKAA